MDSEVALFPEIHYYRIYILSVSNVLKSIQDGFLHGRKKKEGLEMEYKVGVISGDGIGPEIVTEAKKVLDQIGKIYGHVFRYEEILMGGCSIDATGEPLTDAAIASAKASDAVLMGFDRRQHIDFAVVSAAAGEETGGGTFKSSARR